MPAPVRIQSLPQQVANQIAAGEVVERPASVVKELVENSIDAGAERIEVDIEQGGIKLIRVSDDGAGIVHDDLPLAIAPHATSKIRDSRDLEKIASLGFRGEALASIASVSRLILSSHSREEGQGWSLSADGGTSPAAQPPGTRVEVRDLFYNTPARRKFLRAERTEFGHIEEVVRRQALARYRVGFTLGHNGRRVLGVPPLKGGESPRQRVGALMGQPFLRSAIPLDEQAAGLRLWGWLSPATASRPQADRQYFFLNGRVIRDRLVSHALRQAYADSLPEGRHPAYVLYLEIDPAQVDVNVHPTKHEVRFRETRMVHDFIHRALVRALNAEVQEPDGLPGKVEVPAGSGPVTLAAEPSAPNRRTGEGAGIQARHTVLFPPRSGVSPQRIAEQLAGFSALYGADKTTDPGLLGEAVACLYHRYILSRGDGWFLVDRQHAAHGLALQRLRFALEGEGVRKRPLLLPQSIAVGQERMRLAERYADELARHGVVLEPLGEGQLVLRGLPAMLEGVETVDLDPLWPLLEEGGLEHLPEVLSTQAVPGRDESLKALTGELRTLERYDLPECPWRQLDEEALMGLFAGEAV